MHCSVLRSSVELTASRGVGVLRATAVSGRSATTAAAFSTTTSRAALKDVSGRRNRLAAAASEVSALGSDNNNNSKNTSSAAGRPRPGVTDARALGAGDGSSDSGSGGGGGGDGKIINVRSLPRRGGGGGGGARFGGFSTGTRFPGPGVSSTATSRTTAAGGGRFRTAPGGRAPNTNTNPAFQSAPGGGGGLARRGGAAGGGGRGGAAGRSRTGGGSRGGGFAKREKKERPAAEAKHEMDDDQLEWLETHAEDVATVYEPRATTPAGLAEGLKGHGPAVPWGRGWSGAAAAEAGVTETALRAMRVLSGGWAFSAGSTDVLGVEVARERLRLGQRTFFDSAAERVAVEAVLHGTGRAQRRRAQWTETQGSAAAVPSLIAPPSAATKTAIVEAAVRGVYAPPPPRAASAPSLAATPAAFGDPAAAALEAFTRYQAQDHTYSAEHARRFAERARGLLARGQAKA